MNPLDTPVPIDTPTSLQQSTGIQEQIADMVARGWSVNFPSLQGMRANEIRAEKEANSGGKFTAQQGWIPTVLGALAEAVDRLANDTRRIDAHNDGGPPAIEAAKGQVKVAGQTFADVIIARVLPGLERSNAMVKIHEAMHWACAGIERGTEGH